MIQHSTEPQCIYPYVFRMDLIRVLYVVESLEWIATPEADITFGGSAPSPRLCPKTATEVQSMYKTSSVSYYCFIIVSKTSHQY